MRSGLTCEDKMCPSLFTDLICFRLTREYETFPGIWDVGASNSQRMHPVCGNSTHGKPRLISLANNSLPFNSLYANRDVNRGSSNAETKYGIEKEDYLFFRSMTSLDSF